MDITPVAPLLEKDFTPQVDSKSHVGEKTGSALNTVETIGPEIDFEKVLGQTITSKKSEQASNADPKNPALLSGANDNLEALSEQARHQTLFQQSLELLNDIDSLSENIFSNLISNDSKALAPFPSAEYQEVGFNQKYQPFPVQDETEKISADFSSINQIFASLANILHGSFDTPPEAAEAAFAVDEPKSMPFSDHRLDLFSYNFKLSSSPRSSVPYKEALSIKGHYLSVFPMSTSRAETANRTLDLQMQPQDTNQKLFGSLSKSENSELQNILQPPQTATPAASQSQPKSVFNAKFVSITIHNPATNDFVTTGRDQQQTSMLLDQLEKLVGQNNDKVDLTVPRTIPEKQTLPGYLHKSPGNQPIVMTPSNDGGVQLDSLLAPPETIIQQSSETVQPTLRQDAQAQYLSAKIAPADKQTENQSNTETNQQDNSASKQQNLSSQPSSSTIPASETTITNNGFSAQIQGVSQPLTETVAATPTLSNSTPSMVQEDDVIQQLIQRFTINSRLETNKMSLKLHPAELGELKIDVVVKQDSLKANIFAQTQQAHDIIDKHLPRLKAMLQEQGLTVDELFVSLESDSIENFDKQNNNLFQQQLSDFQQQHNGTDASAIEQSFEETVQTAGQETSSVNLTV